MANMSYCRFENTKADMMDCLTALGEPQGASYREIEAAKDMFEEILYTLRDFDVIGEYNLEALYEVIDKMQDPDEIEY